MYVFFWLADQQEVTTSRKWLLSPPRPRPPLSRQRIWRLPATVVPPAEGLHHRGDKLCVQGRLLGGQGAAGLEHVCWDLLRPGPDLSAPDPGLRELQRLTSQSRCVCLSFEPFHVILLNWAWECAFHSLRIQFIVPPNGHYQAVLTVGYLLVAGRGYEKGHGNGGLRQRELRQMARRKQNIQVLHTATRNALWCPLFVLTQTFGCQISSLTLTDANQLWLTGNSTERRTGHWNV